MAAVDTDILFDRLRSMANDDPKRDERLNELITNWKHKHALETQREGYEAEIERLMAQHRQEIGSLRDKAKQLILKAHIRGSAKTRAEPSASGILFGQAMDEYISLQRKATTKRTYLSRLKHSQSYFGQEKDIRQIEQSELADYAKYAYKNVSNSSTAGLYVTTLCGMLNHFRITLGWGSKLTTERLVVKKDTPDSDDRDAFNMEQLRTVFENAARYRIKEPHKYWVTIAIPFLGCRIEELAQINLHEDLLENQVAGIWFFKLHGKANADGSKQRSLKNKQSWRRVPIHSALIERGFVDYLIEQRNNGFSRPFESAWGAYVPDKDPEPKWSHYITNWGGRELAKLRKIEGFAAEGEKLGYFHSMRHTFSGCMGRANVSPEVSEALLGHAYAGVERERYQKLKQDEVRLSVEGVERGLVELVAVLDQMQ